MNQNSDTWESVPLGADNQFDESGGKRMNRVKRLVAIVLIAVCVAGTVGCANEEAAGSRRTGKDDKGPSYGASVELTGTSGQTPEEKAVCKSLQRICISGVQRVCDG